MNLQTVNSGEISGRMEPVTTRTDSAASVTKALSEQKHPTSVVKPNEARKDEKQMAQLLEQAEKMANVFGRNLKFRYRKEADVYQVEVIDAQTDEIVRKIPSDEMVRFIENINDLFGALFDESA